MEFKMNYFIVFRIYRLDPNGISPKIFEPLVVNFIIILSKIPSLEKFVRSLRAQKPSLVAITILGAGENWAPL